MVESKLEKNIRKYPKLKQLVLTDIYLKNAFLKRIRETMERSQLTYKQAVTACQVIDEVIREDAQQK